MYVLNLIFTALVMVPMGISYIVWQGPGFLFYPVWIAGLLAAPLVPTTIATPVSYTHLGDLHHKADSRSTGDSL